jgi:hypothetical protein
VSAVASGVDLGRVFPGRCMTVGLLLQIFVCLLLFFFSLFSSPFFFRAVFEFFGATSEEMLPWAHLALLCLTLGTTTASTAGLSSLC